MFLFASLVILTVFLVIAWSNVLFSPRLINKKRVQSEVSSYHPLVSILLPARNEAHQITNCLESILKNTYSNFEILVADDQSTDGTASLVEDVRRRADRKDSTRLIRIKNDPPDGWTGKANACHILASNAKGEILIFCDADVTLGQNAISSTVDLFNKFSADCVSVLPKIESQSLITKAVTTLIAQGSILVSLPIFLIHRTRSPAIATANGPWLAWRRQAYKEIGGHASVANSLIEDVALARIAKKNKKKLVVALGGKHLTVQMYQTLLEARLGFRKNLFILLDKSYFAVLALTLVNVFLITAPFATLFDGRYDFMTCQVLIILCLLLAFRFALGSSWRAIFFLPISIPISLIFLFESAFFTKKGRVVWKDRTLKSLIQQN